MIVPHEATEKEVKFPFEMIYRSINHYFIESASSEYLFILDFFSVCKELSKGEKDTTFSGKLVISMFKPSLLSIKENLINYINTSFDPIGLLFVLRITSLQKQLMHKRGMEFLDYFFETLDNAVWPRWQQVMQFNIDSLKSHSTEPSKEVLPLRPHYVTRKYSDLVCAILFITSSFKDFRIDESLNFLRVELVALLERLGKQINLQKDKIIFNICNYDQIIQVLKEKNIISTESVTFEELIKREISKYVDIELSTFYSELIKFVEDTEPLIKQKSQLNLDQNKVGKIASNFRDNWKKDVEALAKSILFHHFSNNSLGSDILRDLLLKLSLYNTKFWDIIKIAFGANTFNKFYVANFMITDEFKKWAKF